MGLCTQGCGGRRPGPSDCNRCGALLAAALAAALLVAAAGDAGQCLRRPPPTEEQRRARRSRECTQLVQNYMAQHTADFEGAHDVQKLIFFLHVPRTAGKTYANCFLRTALPPSKRCAKSYDRLRLNASLPGCLALISHDDFSASQFLPPDSATITQLRRPVDRVVSAYEFAVDVAAKGVRYTNTSSRLPRRKADFVGTLAVWPWSQLIPWFKQDMQERMARLREQAQNDPTAWRDYLSPENRTYYWNEAQNKSVWTLPAAEAVLDPYNNSLAMPLHEWIETPVAHELIHNGAALQVLGLTNYSHWQEHSVLRGCLRTNSIAREMLLSLATRRLRSMAHVGLTERLDESVQSMAADLGLNLSGPAYRYTSASAFTYDGGLADPDDPVTYNATTEGGVNKTVTRAEAAARMLEVAREQSRLKREVEEMLPRLDELVEQERVWLEEQEATKHGAAASTSAAAGSSGADGGGSGGGDDQAGYAPSFLAPDVDRADYAPASLAPDVGGASGDGDGGGSGSSSGSNGGGSGGSSSGVGSGAADDEIGDGNTEVAEGEDTEAAVSAVEGSTPAPLEAGAAAGEDGAQAGQQRGGREAAGVGGEAEEEEDEEDYDKIDSPWSEAIEALDAEVSGKQDRLALLESEFASLHESELITVADDATGPAFQLIPDDHYLIPDETLAGAYRRCADAGHTKREKRKPYMHLRTPWGETFMFVPDARLRIARSTISRIQQLNALDEELWKAGESILAAKLEAQRSAGLLQDFPAHPAAAQGPQQQQQQQAQQQQRQQQQQQQPVHAPLRGHDDSRRRKLASLQKQTQAKRKTLPAAQQKKPAARSGTGAGTSAVPGSYAERQAAAAVQQQQQQQQQAALIKDEL